MLTIFSSHVINTQSLETNYLLLFSEWKDPRILQWGDNSISIKENEKLFSYVQLFIKKSGRF